MSAVQEVYKASKYTKAVNGALFHSGSQSAMRMGGGGAAIGAAIGGISNLGDYDEDGSPILGAIAGAALGAGAGLGMRAVGNNYARNYLNATGNMALKENNAGHMVQDLAKTHLGIDSQNLYKGMKTNYKDAALGDGSSATDALAQFRQSSDNYSNWLENSSKTSVSNPITSQPTKPLSKAEQKKLSKQNAQNFKKNNPKNTMGNNILNTP